MYLHALRDAAPAARGAGGFALLAKARALAEACRLAPGVALQASDDADAADCMALRLVHDDGLVEIDCMSEDPDTQLAAQWQSGVPTHLSLRVDDELWIEQAGVHGMQVYDSAGRMQTPADRARFERIGERAHAELERWRRLPSGHALDLPALRLSQCGAGSDLQHLRRRCGWNLAAAAQRMVKHGVRRLPVVDVAGRELGRGRDHHRPELHAGQQRLPQGLDVAEHDEDAVYGHVIAQLMDVEKGLASATVSLERKSGTPLSGGERNHVLILQSLMANKRGMGGEELGRIEGKHKTVGGNALRAAVLGANDAPVSNMSLVMGVAGATDGDQGVLLAGLAGLLAGALSMALGEWISVKSSQELYERQMALEMTELESNHEGERKELVLIFMAKGISEAEAAS